MSYSDAVGHRSMIFDGIRNAAYTRALKKVITPETTVMDLGAGLGIHGMIAARLGASKVYLVEPTVVVEVARKVAADNQLAAVECIQATAEELKLDARVDVIVSVFTGNFLLAEDLLPSLFYARDHFLAPGGQMIPDRGRMEVVPVSAPEYYQKYVDAWGKFPGTCAEQGLPEIDYSAMRAYAANYMNYDTAKHMAAEYLAEPASLMELDFNKATKADCDSQIDVIVESDGLCHGWVGWFQMRLVDEWLSTSGKPKATHWSPVFMPLEVPIQVKAGEKLHFALKRAELGDWTWTTTHAEVKQRQSTFFSTPLTHARMLKASDNYQPTLSGRGAAACWLLARMNGDVLVSDLAEQLRKEFPELLRTDTEALKFVKELAERFS
jgi:Arginine methyltransferase oligomerization subdomain/Ribosomal protein L11 methyltransferase (PrmA)